jgi:transcriptional regulator with XRE-family HTH domain
MSELTNTLREEFKDKETRHVYCDEFLNSSIATQIKVLREQRGLTQRELAERAGMRQERISVLEDVNYSSWTINVLRRLAEAFDLTLTVKFESFGEKLFSIEDMSRETLEKPSFDEDPVFQEQPTVEPAFALGDAPRMWDFSGQPIEVRPFNIESLRGSPTYSMWQGAYVAIPTYQGNRWMQYILREVKQAPDTEMGGEVFVKGPIVTPITELPTQELSTWPM